MEWFVIVPWWQPVFVLVQTYWIGLAVHVLSAFLYPVFPWLRDKVAGHVPARHRRFALAWMGLGAALVAMAAVPAWLGRQGRKWPPHRGDAVAFDQSYLRRMAAHHEQGIMLARLGAERAQDLHLRRMARLMVATQAGDLRIFDHWWRSWFGGGRPPASPQEHATMPGMLDPREIDDLGTMPADRFDEVFRDRMTFHHRGAIAMADEAWRHAAILGSASWHTPSVTARRPEIALMHDIDRGWPTVRAATLAAIEPATLPDGGTDHRTGHP